MHQNDVLSPKKTLFLESNLCISIEWLGPTRPTKDPEGRLPLINHLNPRQLMLLTRTRKIRLLPELSEGEFNNRAKELTELRNDIAHTNDFGCSGGANPLDTIEAVNRAFGLVDATLAAVVRLGQAD
jgi:hypothetical protein